MVEPLSREEASCLIDSYPLIFRVEPEDVFRLLTGYANIQPEFYNFVYSHRDVFVRAVREGTGAVFGAGIINGISHMIEIYLGRPFAEDHLPVIVALMYTEQRVDQLAVKERHLGRVLPG